MRERPLAPRRRQRPIGIFYKFVTLDITPLQYACLEGVFSYPDVDNSRLAHLHAHALDPPFGEHLQGTANPCGRIEAASLGRSCALASYRSVHSKIHAKPASMNNTIAYGISWMTASRQAVQVSRKAP
jgi:hypothetical protein